MRDGLAERRRAAFETAGQPPPPGLFGFGRFMRRSVVGLAEFLACGARDSRFAKVGKHDPGRDGVAAPLSRRADAGDRQAGRHGRAPRLAEQQGPEPGVLEDHFDALRFGLPRPPALAHRLDRDTSGCLVLGRHRKALAQLGKLFRNGAIDKTYWAVVEGGPDADEGAIDLPLGRLDANIGWWMKHDPAGQPAMTKWKVMGRDANSGLTWLALEP